MVVVATFVSWGFVFCDQLLSALSSFTMILLKKRELVYWAICINYECAVNNPKVSKGAKIRNRYNQVPHLTQDTNGKVTNSQLNTTNESQEVSLFPAGEHKVHINRRAQRHSKHKKEQKHKRSTKEVPPWNGQ